LHVAAGEDGAGGPALDGEPVDLHVVRCTPFQSRSPRVHGNQARAPCPAPEQHHRSRDHQRLAVDARVDAQESPGGSGVHSRLERGKRTRFGSVRRSGLRLRLLAHEQDGGSDLALLGPGAPELTRRAEGERDGGEGSIHEVALPRAPWLRRWFYVLHAARRKSRSDQACPFGPGKSSGSERAAVRRSPVPCLRTSSSALMPSIAHARAMNAFAWTKCSRSPTNAAISTPRHSGKCAPIDSRW